MVEIGAGGGSIARRDAMGRILVGPESAGSEPGPACYGRGGEAPTVTDADLLLGRIEPGRFAGGTMTLDGDQARHAMEGMAAGYGDWRSAAFGISEIVDETMAGAARVHAMEQGASLSGRTMIAFGGAAPLHAARLAEKMGIEAVVIPRHAGVGSALGFLQAPIAFATTRSLHQVLARLDVAAVNAVLDSMAAEAHRVVAAGASKQQRSELREAFARYVGQGHEIAVPLPSRPLNADDVPAMLAAFDAVYIAQYGRTIPGMVVEVLTWSVTVATVPIATASVPASPDRANPDRASPDYGSAPTGKTRRVFDPGSMAWIDFAVLERGDLASGACVAGPALIVEDETTTVVPGNFTARVGADGTILLRRREPGATLP
jgi:N-methylhydantoinase A